MRSFILKAAIGAALASLPSMPSYAASSESSHSISSPGEPAARSESSHSISAPAEAPSPARSDLTSLADGERMGREAGRLQMGQSDLAPYMTDSMTANPTYQSFVISPPLTYRGNRLATIQSELGQAAHEINVDRRRGELAPREARLMRREDSAVRAEAIDIARQNGGRIPPASYAMLQDRVSDLDRTIRRYEIGAARG